MRRDLIIGILLSLAIHGGVAMIGKSPPKPKASVEESPTIALMEMPKIEPEEPEVNEAEDQEQTPIDFAPPMQTDVPQIVQLDSFVQPVQPPPPEGLKPNVGVDQHSSGPPRWPRKRASRSSIHPSSTKYPLHVSACNRSIRLKCGALESRARCWLNLLSMQTVTCETHLPFALLNVNLKPLPFRQ